jgi:toxin FitB
MEAVIDQAGRHGLRPHRRGPQVTVARKLPDTLSRLGIAGGAVYDALVALAAKEHGAALATRDARARGTYDAVGVTVIAVT